MKVAVLGDLHQPWARWDILIAFAKFCELYNPDAIVQVGDFIDAHQWGKYEKYDDSPSAADEWDRVEHSCQILQRALEKWRLYIIQGNHCRRMMMRAMEARIPRKLLRTLPEMFPYENWEWHVDQKPLVLDGIAYIHGDELPGKGIAIAQSVGKPTVHGHHHVRAGIDYGDTFGNQLWTMNVGTVMDPESLAGRYANRSIVRCWQGSATVTHGRPDLHPWAWWSTHGKKILN